MSKDIFPSLLPVDWADSVQTDLVFWYLAVMFGSQVSHWIISNESPL